MKTMDPGEMAKRVGDGLLSFPVTHFGENLEFKPKPYQEHIEWLLSYKPAGLFARRGKHPSSPDAVMAPPWPRN